MVDGVVVVSIQVHRLDIVMCSYNSDPLCSSLPSDRVAETNLSWDPFVTMNPRLHHNIDDDVSRGMSSVEKVVEFDSGS